MKVSIIDWIVKKLKKCIGIVEDGDTASSAISKGQYVVWKGSLYTADGAISSGTTLSASGGSKNLTAVTDGGLNSLNSKISNKGTHVYIGSKAGGQDFSLDWNTYDEYYCIAQYGNSGGTQAQCIEQYVRNVLPSMNRTSIALCSGQGGIEVQLTLANQNKLQLSYFAITGTVYTSTSYLFVWGVKK